MTLDQIDEAPTSAPMPARRLKRSALLAAAVVAGFALGFVVHRPAGLATHTVEFGLSAYPATAAASWVDAERRVHNSLPWADRITAVGMRSATIAVTNTDGTPVSCTLTVDEQVVDSQIANRQGDLAVCTWTS